MRIAQLIRLGNLSLLIAFVFSLVHCAKAETFVVTETNDTTRTNSLRGAIIAANDKGGRNTIILGKSLDLRDGSQPWIYRLTISGTNEGAAQGDLSITRGQTMIVGVAPDVIIDATGLGDRVFQVSSNAQLILENLTIRGGTAPGGVGIFASGQVGGAIYNSGTLVLDHCVITNNASGTWIYVIGNGVTGGGDGGGIFNHGRLQADDCIIVRNSCAAGVDSGYGGNGGGIMNDGICNLTHCVVNGNQAGAGGSPAANAFGIGGYGGNGGGIYNFGTMVLNECIVGGNAAGAGASGVSDLSPGGLGGNGGSGGGIYNAGHLEINFSTVYGNNTGNGGSCSFGAGGNGGGIFNAGELGLNTSTISSNSCGDGGNGGSSSAVGGTSGGAGGSGGGIYNSGTNAMLLNPGSAELTSCTITLNECGAGGNGGNGTINSIAINNPTSGDSGDNASDLLTNNAASGGNGGDGGGIANYANTNAVVMRNTLVAQNLSNIGGAPGTNTIVTINQPSSPPQIQIGNPGADGTGFDLAGAFISGGFNLIGMGDGSTGFINGVDTDKVGSEADPIDPLLGPLKMNGGFTPTHALLWGSPAIDQGKCFGIHRDQRDQERPHIFPWIPKPPGGDGSDIGAFELQKRPADD